MDNREAYGYSRGSPMGGDFPSRPSGSSPRLLVSAEQGADGAPLQKLQIVKGWVDDDGHSNNKVFDVAGGHSQEGEINLQTGAWSGPGHSSLCSVFQDPEFQPDQPAYYYLRVVEVPTLRWSWRACVSLPAEQRPAECDNDAPKTIQEMAWTSPIWYLPPDDSKMPANR